MMKTIVLFRRVDGKYIAKSGEEIPTETLMHCAHEIAHDEGAMQAEKLAKVVLCKCGCDKVIMAASIPFGWEDPKTRQDFAEYQVRGHRILLVKPEWVRKNWTEHEEPEQLSLFNPAP